MHGPLETEPPREVSFRGEVWTDARGQATVSLPRDAYPPQTELEYALHPIDGESGVRVTAALREGRFTIATDEPHVKVAWRISRRKEESQMSRTIAPTLQNEELRLCQPVTITSANLGKYTVK